MWEWEIGKKKPFYLFSHSFLCMDDSNGDANEIKNDSDENSSYL